MVAARQFAPRQNQLRAKGNLTYLQFVKLVKHLWAQAHPDIPIIPTGDDAAAKYPAIMYGLELRKSASTDPKPRFREVAYDEDRDPYIVSGQRFENVISFTSITEKDPVLAEEIIETFEDFMLEMTPIFKEMGASEVMYSRRYADGEQSRPSEGVTTRKVAYMIRLEKVTAVKKKKLESFLLNVRQDFVETDEHESWTIEDPRYYYPTCYFGMNQSDLDGDLMTIPRSFFRPGDRVYITQIPWDKENDPNREKFNEYAFPPELFPGYYYIGGSVGDPYSHDIKYSIAETEADALAGNYIEFSDVATPSGEDANGGIYYGRILYEDPKHTEVKIFDSYSHATPWS